MNMSEFREQIVEAIAPIEEFFRSLDLNRHTRQFKREVENILKLIDRAKNTTVEPTRSMGAKSNGMKVIVSGALGLIKEIVSIVESLGRNVSSKRYQEHKKNIQEVENGYNFIKKITIDLERHVKYVAGTGIRNSEDIVPDRDVEIIKRFEGFRSEMSQAIEDIIDIVDQSFTEFPNDQKNIIDACIELEAGVNDYFIAVESGNVDMTIKMVESFIGLKLPPLRKTIVSLRSYIRTVQDSLEKRGPITNFIGKVQRAFAQMGL